MGGMLEYMLMPSRARPDQECSVNKPLRANGPLCGNEQSTLSRTRQALLSLDLEYDRDNIE